MEKVFFYGEISQRKLENTLIHFLHTGNRPVRTEGEGEPKPARHQSAVRGDQVPQDLPRKGKLLLGKLWVKGCVITTPINPWFHGLTQPSLISFITNYQNISSKYATMSI